MLTTSIHLLERLRHREDQAAWERFVSLYSPLLFRWGRQSGMPIRDASDHYNFQLTNFQQILTDDDSDGPEDNLKETEDETEEAEDLS